MKITYLFLVYKNADFVYHTCKMLEGNDIYFHVHIDKKSKENFKNLSSVKNLTFSKNRYDAKWAGSELVQATLDCFREIKNMQRNGFVILMSEADYPVKSSSYIREYLFANNRDFIKCVKLPNDNPLDTPYSRWVEGGMRRVNAYALRLTERQIATIEPYALNWGNFRQFAKVLIYSPIKIFKAVTLFFSKKRIVPPGITYYGGDQWFMLRIQTVGNILKYIDEHTELLKEADYMDTPDEIVIQSLVGSLIQHKEIVNKTGRYVHWPKKYSSSPTYLTMNDNIIIDAQIDDKNVLFVRKIQDIQVANYIDRKIR